MSTPPPVALLAPLLLVGGCVTEAMVGSPGAWWRGEGEGLAVRSASQDHCETDRFHLLLTGETHEGRRVEQEASVEPDPDLDCVPPEELGLPEEESRELSGCFVVGPHFFGVPPGRYDLAVTALDADGVRLPVTPNPRSRTRLEVFEGQTTPTGLAFPCDGLQVWVLVSEGPDLVDFHQDSGAFPLVCEEAHLEAVFEQDAPTELEVRWSMFGPRADGGAPGPLHHTETTAVPAAPGPRSAPLAWPCDAPGTFDVQVTATEPQGAETSFATALHCTEPPEGACTEGDAVLGAMSCATADLIPLDGSCAASEYGALPPCTEICP